MAQISLRLKGKLTAVSAGDNTSSPRNGIRAVVTAQVLRKRNRSGSIGGCERGTLSIIINHRQSPRKTLTPAIEMYHSGKAFTATS